MEVYYTETSILSWNLLYVQYQIIQTYFSCSLTNVKRLGIIPHTSMPVVSVPLENKSWKTLALKSDRLDRLNWRWPSGVQHLHVFSWFTCFAGEPHHYASESQDFSQRLLLSLFAATPADGLKGIKDNFSQCRLMCWHWHLLMTWWSSKTSFNNTQYE